MAWNCLLDWVTGRPHVTLSQSLPGTALSTTDSLSTRLCGCEAVWPAAASDAVFRRRLKFGREPASFQVYGFLQVLEEASPCEAPSPGQLGKQTTKAEDLR